MTPPRRPGAVFRDLAAPALLLLLPPAAGHGYLKSPRARNFVAHEDGAWWPIDPAGPAPESEPQSANIGGVEGRCGIIAGARNYDVPQNQAGGPLAPAVQACWSPGEEVELAIRLTAREFRRARGGRDGNGARSADPHPLTPVSLSFRSKRRPQRRVLGATRQLRCRPAQTS